MIVRKEKGKYIIEMDEREVRALLDDKPLAVMKLIFRLRKLIGD